jgi:hypothetical protein
MQDTTIRHVTVSLTRVVPDLVIKLSENEEISAEIFVYVFFSFHHLVVYSEVVILKPCVGSKLRIENYCDVLHSVTLSVDENNLCLKTKTIKCFHLTFSSIT